ncbi:hypothetical protein [Candidatus Azobacteroides pseudotrichonymphae]|nr:hypothetical protein [Candidatus Azobacteroides pseudotrichonymphae]
MVYEIKGDCIIVHLLFGHYDDK